VDVLDTKQKKRKEKAQGNYNSKIARKNFLGVQGIEIVGKT
jgi:hypothetical protein